ncbi:ribosomal protein L7/L12 [Streptomyces sp. XD-27]|nr:ribosomal protein L7/L12 [Streptomyces sp. XD-27]WKX74234.1 ribosomal protein L7/L12 [Streptomyces sp. XD-27]
MADLITDAALPPGHSGEWRLAPLGLREDDPELGRVAELARNGKKVQAIKVYREVTGAGLKEAKDAVDRMA